MKIEIEKIAEIYHLKRVNEVDNLYENDKILMIFYESTDEIKITDLNYNKIYKGRDLQKIGEILNENSKTR